MILLVHFHNNFPMKVMWQVVIDFYLHLQLTSPFYLSLITCHLDFVVNFFFIFYFLVLVALLLKYFNFLRKEKKMFQIFSHLLKKKIKKTKKLSKPLVYFGIDSKRYLHMCFFTHSCYFSLGTNCVFWTKKYLVCFICSKTSLCLSTCLG